MLGRAAYSKTYIDAVRKRVAAQLKAFDKAKPAEPFASDALLNMVLGLELAFVHRLRMQEGKDGNPLNEMRMLAISVLENDGVMMKDNTVKWDAAKAVTGIAIGEKIALSRKQLAELAEAFLGEVETKYG